MREGWVNRVIEFCISLKKYGELGSYDKFSLFQSLQCTYSFSKSTKVVFCIKGEWHSLSMLPIIVHGPLSILNID